MVYMYSVLFERPSLRGQRGCVCSFTEEKYTSPYEKLFCKALFTRAELISQYFPLCWKWHSTQICEDLAVPDMFEVGSYNSL